MAESKKKGRTEAWRKAEASGSYKCRHCGFNFLTVQDLADHIKLVHLASNGSSSMWQCDQCGTAKLLGKCAEFWHTGHHINCYQGERDQKRINIFTIVTTYEEALKRLKEIEELRRRSLVLKFE